LEKTVEGAARKSVTSLRMNIFYFCRTKACWVSSRIIG
jgi:hypothetical protein